MPHIRFLKDFDWSPPAMNGRVTIAYRAGMTENVTRDCADLAMSTGHAVAKTPDESADVGKQ